MDETNPKDTTTNPATGTNQAPAAPAAVPIDDAAVERAAATISEHIVHLAAKVPAPPAPQIPPPAPPVKPVPVPPPAPPVPVPPPVQPPRIPVPPVPATPVPPPSIPAPRAAPIPPVPAITVPPVMVPPVSPAPVIPPMPVPPVFVPSPVPPAIPVIPIPPAEPAAKPAPVQPALQQIPVPPAGEAAAAPAEATLPPETADKPAKSPLREDIARIIGKIKLPERITVKMSGEKAKPPSPAVPPAEEKPPGDTKPAQGDVPAQTGQPKEAPSSVVSVHTLKDDLQHVVRDKKMSLVRAVALESEKKKGQEHLGGPHSAAGKTYSPKIIGVAFVGVILLALGLVAFVGVRSVLQQGAGNREQAAAPALIFAEKTLTFPQETRTGIDLKRTLMAGVRSVPSMSLGAIMHIVPTSPQTDANGAALEHAMSIGEFLNAIGAQASPELIRSLRGDFFLGFHQTAGKLSPVIVIPVTSYERAFAGMLAWEPFMNNDLTPVFSPIPPQTLDEKGLFVEREFQDTLINNYDVRFFKDDSGTAQMMYSFPTRTMLIISESPYSFTEVLSRLRAARQL